MSPAVKISLLGAESTGKTHLAQQLAAHFTSRGISAQAVPEALRDWCEREQRPPRPEEQMTIAQEQERRVDEASKNVEMVFADTTALMVAIYGAMLFPDDKLYRFAIERQRSYDLTLLTGLDLPWVADGLQRADAQVREHVDALIRELLHKENIAYRVVYGSGQQRLRNALAAIGQPNEPGNGARPWTWHCEKCSDPDCEHRLFSRLRI